MAASGGHLIPIGARIERSCELDTFQRLFSHDHSLQLHLAHNDSPSIQKGLDARCILGLCWIEVHPCSIAQSGLVTRDIDIVFDADSSSIERTRLGWLVIAARWYNDSSTGTSTRSVEGNQRMQRSALAPKTH